MENTAGAATSHLPHLSPLLSFSHYRQSTVAAIPIGEAPDFPASHPPLWPRAAARFASENEFRFAGG